MWRTLRARVSRAPLRPAPVNFPSGQVHRARSRASPIVSFNSRTISSAVAAGPGCVFVARLRESAAASAAMPERDWHNPSCSSRPRCSFSRSTISRISRSSNRCRRRCGLGDDAGDERSAREQRSARNPRAAAECRDAGKVFKASARALPAAILHAHDAAAPKSKRFLHGIKAYVCVTARPR